MFLEVSVELSVSLRLEFGRDFRGYLRAVSMFLEEGVELSVLLRL